MKYCLIFKSLNDDILLNENINYCKFTFGNIYNPKSYIDIRKIAYMNYKKLVNEDLYEKEDTLKNKLIQIQNSNFDTKVTSALSIITIILTMVSILCQIFTPSKINTKNTTPLLVYFISILLSSCIFLIITSFSNKVKTIDFTFYNLCLEELQKVKQERLAKKQQTKSSKLKIIFKKLFH